MATTDDLHSNALNFISASVDPRTGQFTAAITLPVGAANGLKGPTPSLNLSYNPFRSLPQGFGVGWQLGLSQWDRLANRLTLSTGESFITVPPVQGEYGFKDRKLPSFRLFSDGSESLKLVHKTGLVEYLTSYGTPIYRLYALRSPEGQRVRLYYDVAMRLTRLVDDSGAVLVSMGYFDTGTEVRLFPQDTTRAAMQVNFLFDRNELRYVRLMDADRASFEFHYLQHASGLLLLQQFIWPTGGRESVGYDSYMQAMPPGAPLTHMPVVWEYVRAPEHGQSASRSTFAYSAHNCHGYGAVTQWSSLEDNLYKRVEPYAYDSTETQWADGVATRYIYREFNRFHLQTAERVTCEGYLAESLTQYHDLASLPFALQPAYFQLPRQITRRYARHGQEQAPLLRVEQFRYDDFGNPVWQCDAMGGVQEHVYYPAAGQFEDCPADPLGFVRFVQTSTTYPPPGSQGAPRGVQYRYALLPAPDGGSDHVVPLSAQQYEVVDGHPVDLDRVTQAFVSSGEHHGRMAWSDVQHQGHVTHTEYEYALQASGTVSLLLRQQPTLLTTTRLVGFDGQSVSRNEARSVVHGQLVLTSAEASATTVYDYDSMGRLVTETTAPGTAYEATLSYKHIVSAQGSYQTLTGVAGAVTQIMLDGFGREIQRLQSDVDGALYVSGEAGYDALGQLAFTRTLEPGVPQADGRFLDLCLETRYRYDGWGNVVKTERPDGVSECSEHDPNALLRTDWLQAGEAISQRTVYELDLRGQPLTRTTWHGRQVVSEHFHYDGFGRLLTHTDALGQVTTHAYDAWDREVSSVLPDGTRVSRDYAVHDPGAVPTAIRVQHSSLGSAPVLLGTQRFDGLGRLVQRVVAGRATDYTYDLAHFSPGIVTSAAGQAHCRYQPALAQALSSFSASGEQLSYEYHPLYGQPVQLSNDLGSQRLHYDALGQVDQETLLSPVHTLTPPLFHPNGLAVGHR